MEMKSMRIAYGEALVKLGEKNDKTVVLDADLAHATMTSLFKEKFNDRFFNVGIAEQNLMSMAAGLSLTGNIAFASTFALFGSGRAYEQVRNSICYSNLNVKIALTHSGLTVGEDGGSHQSIEDIALMRVIPNMTVVVPCDAIETEKIVFAISEIEGPVYLRIARLPVPIFTKPEDDFSIGKCNVVKQGSKVCIFATGIMVYKALEAANMLEADGIATTVINVHTIKPIDKDFIIEMAKNHENLFSIEEHSVIGGLGSAIAEVLIKEYPKKLDIIGVNDVFGESGVPDDLLDYHGLSSEKIYNYIKIKN